MHKGICFYFGYDIDVKEKAKMIADAGFDSVITSADPKFVHQNGTISQQAKWFKKAGLNLSSLHMRYNRDELSHFFEDDKIGQKIEKNLIQDVKIAKKFGFNCVVVHLKGNISFVGVERFKRILRVAEKYEIPLALENLRDLRPLYYFLDNFKSPYVKFCYDSGHNHAYNKKIDLLSAFGDRLICVHLHDNDGTKDAHDLNKFGTIDWQSLAEKLAKTNLRTLDYELIPKENHALSAEEFLREALKQANSLEKMIREKRREIRERKKKKIQREKRAKEALLAAETIAQNGEVSQQQEEQVGKKEVVAKKKSKTTVKKKTSGSSKVEGVDGVAEREGQVKKRGRPRKVVVQQEIDAQNVERVTISERVIEIDNSIVDDVNVAEKAIENKNVNDVGKENSEADKE